MAVNQNDIDKLAGDIANMVLRMEEELVAGFMELKGAMSTEAFIQVLQEVDVSALVAQKSATIISRFGEGHQLTLLQMENIGAITETTLSALYNFSTDNLIAEMEAIASVVRNKVLQGIIAGMGEGEIVASITASTLSKAQLRTVVNTALNTYSRAVNKVMMDTLPASVKYVYVGAIDEKTRPECLDMAAAGALTQEQIENSFGAGVLIDGGGFNCRHQWEMQSAKQFGHHPGAAGELRANA